MKKFDSKSCEEIMTTIYKPIEFYVENLIAQGLYILAGAPKVGKSWLSLDICLSIAKGEKVLGQPTSQGTVLYLCLEDSFRRIQNRLYDMTDEPVENLFFSVMADSIGYGLEEQIEVFKTEHSDLKIVFIDTLQMIRNSDQPSYSSDYKELTVLKSLADKLGIAIVIVHHTRKSIDSDPFNMISGSTGLSGCVDGSMVLIETKRGSRKAVMHCVGRDIENREISLVFNNDIKKWIVTDELKEPKSKENIFLAALYVYLKDKISFSGTATELSKELKNVSAETFYPNRITRDLVQNGYDLKKYGIDFQYKRTRMERKIILHYDSKCDSSDSKDSTVVTVNKSKDESTSNPLYTLICGDNRKRDSKKM